MHVKARYCCEASRTYNPLSDAERSAVIKALGTDVSDLKGISAAIMRGALDTPIRAEMDVHDLSIEECGRIWSDVFSSLSDLDSFNAANLTRVGVPHWSETAESTIFPLTFADGTTVYWACDPDGYGRKVSRSTYSHSPVIGNEFDEGVKKGKKDSSRAEKWLKEVLAEFNKNPNRYKDGYEIEDLMDTIGVKSDELEDHEKELDYVVAGLAKAGFEML